MSPKEYSCLQISVIDKIKCCLIVNLIAFPHLNATGWEIYLGNYNITKFLRMFIVSKVFLAFELKIDLGLNQSHWV